MAAEQIGPAASDAAWGASHHAGGTDGPVDIGEALRRSDVLAALDEIDRELVGLEQVKARIRDIAAFALVALLRHSAGLTGATPTLHMCFTGRPGTGKTTVALRMARVLKRLGYLSQGHLVVATRADLIGRYVGHTAPKTRDVLGKATGGVLFVDEAYHLYRPGNERDYGLEAIEMLLEAMENRRAELVVILAGYKEKMRGLFAGNPGLHSRIAYHIDFPDYTLAELTQIADLMLSQQMYRWDSEARSAFREYLRPLLCGPDFANGRTVRNAIDRIKLCQAWRLVRQGGRVGKQELMRIDAADIRQSRIREEQVGEQENLDRIPEKTT